MSTNCAGRAPYTACRRVRCGVHMCGGEDVHFTHVQLELCSSRFHTTLIRCNSCSLLLCLKTPSRTAVEGLLNNIPDVSVVKDQASVESCRSEKEILLRAIASASVYGANSQFARSRTSEFTVQPNCNSVYAAML